MKNNKNQCTEFLKWALPQLGLRWEGYRRVKRQVCKRINARIAFLQLSGFGSYKEYLSKNPGEWTILDGMMHISISRFFRDHKSWELLGDSLLPELAARAVGENRPLRCWSVGCASGEEPYSLAILYHQILKNSFPSLDFQLIATDANTDLLQRAAKACYPAGNVKNVPAKWLQSSFNKTNGEYCLHDNMKNTVTFLRQDIREELPDEQFDLIFCKNLVGMYFATEIAIEVYNRIAEKIRHKGFLFTGNHEPVPIEKLSGMQIYNRGLNIFKKCDS